MDKQIDRLLERIKVTARTAGGIAAKAAGVSAQKAGELFEMTKNSVKIMSIEKEIDDVCAKIGLLVYEAHKDPEADTSQVDEMLTSIDEKVALIAELREKDSELRDEKACPSCGEKNSRAFAYCSHCGAGLR